VSDSVFFYKALQLGLWNGELRGTTIQADHQLWKYPYDRLGQALNTGEMNGEFSVQIAQVLRLARLASHFSGLSSDL
jgi:hypothetical protein